MKQGVFVYIISQMLGTVVGNQGTPLKVDKTFLTSSPYLLNALYLVGGDFANEKQSYQDIMYYTDVMYQHFKPIGITTDATPL
ncbi:hypothetical protein [Pseudogracilibacillus sp. ICA-222130]|uniref:hypothetical protein n=1 Tax=Pseudogracilibacillus sp. ICA-222130 TaxID=3134655 RepID=UPI0030C560CF